MTTDNTREAFEKFSHRHMKNNVDVLERCKIHPERYWWEFTQTAWEAWQAALDHERARLMPMLEQARGSLHASNYLGCHDAVIAAINEVLKG